MATEKDGPIQERFVPGRDYQFTPPVETNCFTVAGGLPERRVFANGWCLKYDGRHGVFVFQGKPVDDTREFYFHLEWGKGSVAEDVPRPPLRVVE